MLFLCMFRQKKIYRTKKLKKMEKYNNNNNNNTAKDKIETLEDQLSETYL